MGPITLRAASSVTKNISTAASGRHLHLGRKRMLARFSVLDKYECPSDFVWLLHSLGCMDPEAKSAAPSVTNKTSTANGVAKSS